MCNRSQLECVYVFSYSNRKNINRIRFFFFCRWFGECVFIWKSICADIRQAHVFFALLFLPFHAHSRRNVIKIFCSSLWVCAYDTFNENTCLLNGIDAFFLLLFFCKIIRNIYLIVVSTIFCSFASRKTHYRVVDVVAMFCQLHI